MEGVCVRVGEDLQLACVESVARRFAHAFPWQATAQVGATRQLALNL